MSWTQHHVMSSLWQTSWHLFDPGASYHHYHHHHQHLGPRSLTFTFTAIDYYDYIRRVPFFWLTRGFWLGIHLTPGRWVSISNNIDGAGSKCSMGMNKDKVAHLSRFCYTVSGTVLPARIFLSQHYYHLRPNTMFASYHHHRRSPLSSSVPCCATVNGPFLPSFGVVFVGPPF
jgi:hypothetical protein